MVELVDTLVSGTSASQLGGSSPPQGIFYRRRCYRSLYMIRPRFKS